MSGWFGRSWGAPVCDPESHVPTPVGENCPYCTDPIAADDRGMVVGCLGEGGTTDTAYYHRLCMMLNVIPCTMWDPEMHDHAERIGYEHSDACSIPRERREGA